MNDKEKIIEYFKTRNQQGSGWWLLLAVPVIAIALPIWLVFAAGAWVYVSTRSMFSKNTNDKTTEYPYEILHKQGVKLVIGYDASNKEAAAIVNELEKRYPDQTRLYDWSSTKGIDLDTISTMPSPQQEYASVIVGDTCCGDVLSPVVEKDSPITVYVIAIQEIGDEFLTAYPLLDNWETPTRVLDESAFIKEVDDFMQHGIIPGDELNS